jgi:hypothetical protein
MFLCRVEFNAGDWFVFTVFLLEICAGHQVYWANFASSCWFFITKHFEIVLEHIDDFIRLESLFHSVLNAVDELVQLFINVAATSRLFSNLVDEVFWIVLDARIYGSIEVGLSLKSLDWICCLKTHLENLFLGIDLYIWWLCLELKINSLVSCILLNHLVVLKTEFSAQFWNAHFNKWSTEKV